MPDRSCECGYDPFWVRAYPYRVDLRKDDTQTVQITVRNFRDTPQKHRVELKLPPGIGAEPRVLEGTVAAKSRQSFPVKLTVKDRAALGAGVRIVPFDITLDGKRQGELSPDEILPSRLAPRRRHSLPDLRVFGTGWSW